MSFCVSIMVLFGSPCFIVGCFRASVRLLFFLFSSEINFVRRVTTTSWISSFFCLVHVCCIVLHWSRRASASMDLCYLQQIMVPTPFFLVCRRVWSEFKSGVVTTLVTTDVVARGVNVPQVNMVVNYDVPETVQGRGAGQLTNDGAPSIDWWNDSMGDIFFDVVQEMKQSRRLARITNAGDGFV